MESSSQKFSDSERSIRAAVQATINALKMTGYSNIDPNEIYMYCYQNYWTTKMSESVVKMSNTKK